MPAKLHRCVRAVAPRTGERRAWAICTAATMRNPSFALDPPDVQRFIYRCGYCRARWSSAYLDQRTERMVERGSVATGFRQVRVVDHRYTRTTPEGEIQPSQERCPGCGRKDFVQGGAVKGVYNPRVPCSAKCWDASGFDCSCRCAGANHGRSLGGGR